VRPFNPPSGAAIGRGAFLALCLVAPLRAEVCIDTAPYSVSLPTASYKAPTSTTTTKAGLLSELYRTRYDRDNLRIDFWDAVSHAMYWEEEALKWRLRYEERSRP